MPRLSTQRYLSIHHQLKHFWLTDQNRFATLSSQDQFALHRYFQTTSDASADLLIRTRIELTKLEPSLPQRAGKARKLLETTRQPQPRSVPVKGKRIRGERVTSVRSVVRPVPDIHIHKLARAFEYFRPVEQGCKSSRC